MDVAKASHAIQESLKLAGGAAAAAVMQVLPSTGKTSSSMEVQADPQAAPGSSISPKMAATREFATTTVASRAGGGGCKLHVSSPQQEVHCPPGVTWSNQVEALTWLFDILLSPLKASKATCHIIRWAGGQCYLNLSFS